MTDKMIAAELGLSRKTVDSHWKRLRDLFSSSSRVNIVAQVMLGDFEIERGKLAADFDALSVQVREGRSLDSFHTDRVKELEETLQERNRLFAEINRSLYREMAERQSLIEGSEQLRHLLEAGRIYFYWINAQPPFTCQFISEGVRAFGWTPEQWMSGEVTMLDAIHPDDLSAIYELVPARIKVGRETAACQFRLTDGKGKQRWVLDRNRLELDESGSPYRFSGFTYDLTDDIADGIWPHRGFQFWS